MWQFIVENFNEFLTYTGFANATAGNLIMIALRKTLNRCYSYPSVLALFSETYLSALMQVWKSVFTKTIRY